MTLLFSLLIYSYACWVLFPNSKHLSLNLKLQVFNDSDPEITSEPKKKNRDENQHCAFLPQDGVKSHPVGL